tara:strand:- start:1825 stop:2097 length:273 start_codon:yes stop_codon:yes gene_type:complete
MYRDRKQPIKTQAIIKDIEFALNLDDDQLNAESSSNDFQEWDSMGTINLIAFLEDKYDCKFDLLEMPLFNNVKAILEILKKKGLEIEFSE